jgi:hypothetical protein
MHTSSHWRVLARRLGPRLGPLFGQTVWTRSLRRTLICIHMLGAGMADYAPLHATTLRRLKISVQTKSFPPLNATCATSLKATSASQRSKIALNPSRSGVLGRHMGTILLVFQM